MNIIVKANGLNELKMKRLFFLFFLFNISIPRCNLEKLILSADIIKMHLINIHCMRMHTELDLRTRERTRVRLHAVEGGRARSG